MTQNQLTLEQKFEIQRMRGAKDHLSRAQLLQLLQEAKRLLMIKTKVLNHLSGDTNATFKN